MKNLYVYTYIHIFKTYRIILIIYRTRFIWNLFHMRFRIANIHQAWFRSCWMYSKTFLERLNIFHLNGHPRLNFQNTKRIRFLFHRNSSSRMFLETLARPDIYDTGTRMSLIIDYCSILFQHMYSAT